jgi:hypothetical protein
MGELREILDNSVKSKVNLGSFWENLGKMLKSLEKIFGKTLGNSREILCKS